MLVEPTSVEMQNIELLYVFSKKIDTSMSNGRVWMQLIWYKKHAKMAWMPNDIVSMGPGSIGNRCNSW